MAEPKTYSAAERAQLFAMSTRQNLQMLTKETLSTTPGTVQFHLPKSRFLSSIMLRVKATVKLKHETKTSLLDETDIFTAYRALRRISLDLNNGFQPFVLSGQDCAMLNMIDIHPDIIAPVTEDGAYNHCPIFTASADGTDNTFEFTICLDNTLNRRDPISLICLQTDNLNVTCSLDFGNGSEMFANVEGLTAELKDITVSAMTTTYSIPDNANAYPDISILKLSTGRSDALPSAGQQTVKLTTGTIYRKLIFLVTDEDGNPVDDEFIQSNIDLVFNQADTNYSVSPEMLRVYNHRELGYQLPKGMYVLDFSNGGSFANYGGSRDYIDTAKLSELWLRFTTKGKGKIDIVCEHLSRLVQA